MPLHDHFRPPISGRLPWPSLHTGWIGEITARLNEVMPPGYLALDTVRFGGKVEIDVATVEEDGAGSSGGRNGHPGAGEAAVATAAVAYTPPPALFSWPFAFPDVAELRVYRDRDGMALVGAIELVSPANKDREESRAAFTAKCLDYLAAGAGVVVVDVVTSRHANLHDELVRLLGAPAAAGVRDDADLYASAYRPVVRDGVSQVDVWVHPFAVGDPLPTVPLRLVADLFVPVELELTYTEACRRRRLF